MGIFGIDGALAFSTASAVEDNRIPVYLVVGIDYGTVVSCDSENLTHPINSTTAKPQFISSRKTLRPDNHRLTMHMTGNAVPPLAGQRILEALKAAA